MDRHIMNTIENNKTIASELKLLTDKFKERLPETIQEIINLWSSFKINNSSIDILNITYQNLHKLTGSAGTFGYPHLSETSRNEDGPVTKSIKSRESIRRSSTQGRVFHNRIRLNTRTIT